MVDRKELVRRRTQMWFTSQGEARRNHGRQTLTVTQAEDQGYQNSAEFWGVMVKPDEPKLPRRFLISRYMGDTGLMFFEERHLEFPITGPHQLLETIEALNELFNRRINHEPGAISGRGLEWFLNEYLEEGETK